MEKDHTIYSSAIQTKRNYVVILGAGESGVGAAILARKKGYQVFVSDKSVVQEKYKTELHDAHIQFEEGIHTEEKILSAEFVIKSPGIPDKVEIIQKLKHRNTPIISEIEFAARYTKAKYIAITGTNGKTTTTLLTYHLMKKAGFKVGLAGNVGSSFARQVANAHFDFYVLELSSFQLDGMYDFKADVAILLNITPDHLDRYQYDFQNYVDSKFRIIRNMTSKETFIYYQENQPIIDELQKKDYTVNKIPFALTRKDNSRAWMENNHLHFAILEKEFKIPTTDITIQGPHNMINTMAAVSAALTMGADLKKIKEGLKDFENAPHRLEFAGEIKGIKFINDSKATNVDSVTYALASFNEPLVWIAGGTDKGNDYAALNDLVKQRVKALVCMGADNSKIASAFKDILPVVKETNSIKDAVSTAFQLAAKGDTVLLSPACASFDLFKNYEDRGEKFKATVKELKTKIEKK
jgi:UDP-N-acetylmuramoylalanine--D-glutamate ligase